MVSEKSVTVIAVLAVVVSAAGLIFSMVAYSSFQNWLVAFSPGATKNQTLGTVNVTIESNLAIRFTNDTIDWGTGAVGSTFNYANLTTEGEFVNWLNSTTANVTNGFVLENIGNLNGSLYIKTDKNATQFLMGGVASSTEKFLYKLRECSTVGDRCDPYSGMRVQDVNDTVGSCGVKNITFNQYRDVNASAGLGDLVCQQFGWENNMDEIRIDINVEIPTSAPSGAKGAIMTATAELP